MGKADFPDIYVGAVNSLEARPTIKLSAFCSKYRDGSNYAGIIIYHTYGRHSWQQKPNQGVAGRYRGRSFYVLIQCTDEWPEHALRKAGSGQVHDYLYRQYFDADYTCGWTCCGGFSVMKGVLKHSSAWLNNQSGCMHQLEWRGDGSKYLSPVELDLVMLAVKEWRASGPAAVVDIPDALHNEAVRLATVPVRVHC